MGVSDEVKRQAREAKQEAKPWVVKLARAGYAAKGIVYILIGAIAFDAASGAGSANVDQQKALTSILTQRYGAILLALVALGLFGYLLWRLVEAIENPEHKGITSRIGYAISGIGYGALGVFAVQLLMGGASSSGSGSAAQDWTARIMSYPLGRWIIGAAGLIILGVGLYQLYAAYKVKFEQRLKTEEMDSSTLRWAIGMGRLGYAARGIVYSLIGYFLIQAALQYNPQQAGGLGEALQTLAGQPYGPWLLGIVALGLLAYGIYAEVLARYRRIYM